MKIDWLMLIFILALGSILYFGIRGFCSQEKAVYQYTSKWGQGFNDCGIGK